MKNITIAGGITRDAELRTAGSDKVLGFSVAVSEGFGDKKRTLYFDCNLWGKRGETLAGMLTKGGKVSVSGSAMTTRGRGHRRRAAMARARLTTRTKFRSDDPPRSHPAQRG
jgi:single-strand DNA-binding protein